MRVLFIDFTLPYLFKDSEYPVGGWAVELNSWLVGLKQSGHHAGVLSWKGASAFVGPTDLCEILDTYDPEKGIPVAKFFYSYIPSMLAAAKRFKPDLLVQACAGVNTGIMAFIANRLGVPFVYRVANDPDTDDRYRVRMPEYAGKSYRYGLKQSAAIFCQNEYQLRELTKRYPGKALSIIHNPFAPPVALDAALPRSERKGIAWLGVFHDRKNMPLLCKIARNLPHVNFRVAGMPSQPMSDAVARSIEELKSLPNIELVGYVRRTDVMAFLKNAVALLNTSNHEGFSNTFLEAFAAGTPLLIRRQIDPDGIVEKFKLGAVAEDEEGLQANIEALYALEGAEYEAVSKRCQDYVSVRHNPVAKVSELIDLVGPFLKVPA